MTLRPLGWVALCAVLAGCPQEREGAEKKIPPQALPPAVTVEPPGGVHAAPPTALPVTDGGPGLAAPAVPTPPPHRP